LPGTAGSCPENFDHRRKQQIKPYDVLGVCG